MADTKISALTEAAPELTDYLPFVDDPGGTPSSKRCDVSKVAGMWELLATANPSNVASVDFTSLSTDYDIHKVVIHNFTPATDGADAGFRVSNDNGSTWEVSAYDASSHTQLSGDEYAANSVSVEFPLMYGIVNTTYNIGNASNENGHFMATFYDLTQSRWTHFRSDGVGVSAGGLEKHYRGFGQHQDTTANDGLRFFAGTGNISATAIYLYGRRA